MRAPAYWRFLLVALLAGVFFFGLSGQRPAHAGGPLLVGGAPLGFGPDAQPFTWDTTNPINYTTDGGMLGTLSETEANDRVATMFQVWADVSTATIGFNRAGSIMSAGVFTDGDVDTMEEFDAVEGSCNSRTQSPIVYDADGSLFDDLVGDPNVIGFAGICFLALDSSGRINAAIAALNGKFQDGVGPAPGDPELSANEFDAVFIHEFGHFFGLDHSQINQECLASLGGCLDGSDETFALPTMFPFLIRGLEESMGVHPARTLARDDIAWVSRLYPVIPDFNDNFGTITGTIFFSDMETPVQGVNVIVRNVADPQIAVSVVSGFLFTGNPGQSVTGTNPGSSFGSRTPTLIGFYRIPGLPPGNYTIEVESINLAFEGGSSVGPLNPPIPSPGPAEFFSSPEDDTDGGASGIAVMVVANTTTSGIDIILNGTPPRFDQFER
jgi:hypothetical protein